MKPLLRRLAALALILGAVFLGGRLLGVFGSGPVPVELHYLLGDPPRAASLEVTFRRQNDVVAQFESSLVAPDVVQSTRLPAGQVALSITLVGKDGARKSLTRSIEAERNLVVRFDLSRELP